MKKTFFSLFLALSALSTQAQQRTSNDMPQIVPIYANNLVLVKLCSETDYPVKQMNQKEVLDTYLKQGGEQRFFESDVRYYGKFFVEVLSPLVADKSIVSQCKSIKESDEALENLRKKDKELYLPQKEVNPLNM